MEHMDNGSGQPPADAARLTKGDSNMTRQEKTSVNSKEAKTNPVQPDQPVSAAPLHYALVGCGKVAKKHLQAALYHKQDIALTALVDTRPEAAAALLRSCGFSEKDAALVPVYTDIAIMLQGV